MTRSLFLKCKIYQPGSSNWSPLLLELWSFCRRFVDASVADLLDLFWQRQQEDVCVKRLFCRHVCVFAGAACAGFSSQSSHTNPNSLSLTLRFCRGMVLPAVALTLSSVFFSLYFADFFLLLLVWLLPQSGGFRHRLWVGGSRGRGEVLVVQKQRFS